MTGKAKGLAGRHSLDAEPRTPGARLADLAHRVRRLAPSHRDPEWFHAEKDEIARALHRLADLERTPR